MKRVLAIAILGLLGTVILGLVLRISPFIAWSLLIAALLAGGWLATRPSPHRLSRVTDVWQGQSRATATALMVLGTVALVAGMLYEAGNPPNGYGLLLFATASICLGIGIHRNVRVVSAYFGRPWGWILNSLQFGLPLIAFGLEYVASAVSNKGSTWLLRFLAVIPFLFLYLVIWVPLARRESSTAPISGDTTVGRLG